MAWVPQSPARACHNRDDWDRDAEARHCSSQPQSMKWPDEYCLQQSSIFSRNLLDDNGGREPWHVLHCERTEFKRSNRIINIHVTAPVRGEELEKGECSSQFLIELQRPFLDIANTYWVNWLTRLVIRAGLRFRLTKDWRNCLVSLRFHLIHFGHIHTALFLGYFLKFYTIFHQSPYEIVKQTVHVTLKNHFLTIEFKKHP